MNVYFKSGLSSSLLFVILFCAISLGNAQTFYPDDIGNTWVMESKDKIDTRTVTITGPETLNGEELKIIQEQTNNNVGQLFVKTEADGLKLVRSIVSLPLIGKITFDYSPPQVFLPIPIELGATWTVTSEADVALVGKIRTTNRVEVVAIEDVTVPAGKFENCLKIQQEASVKLTIAELAQTSAFWLAPDVGLVKATDSKDVVFELISFDIAPREPLIAVQPKGKLAMTWAAIKRR